VAWCIKRVAYRRGAAGACLSIDVGGWGIARRRLAGWSRPRPLIADVVMATGIVLPPHRKRALSAGGRAGCPRDAGDKFSGRRRYG